MVGWSFSFISERNRRTKFLYWISAQREEIAAESNKGILSTLTNTVGLGKDAYSIQNSINNEHVNDINTFWGNVVYFELPLIINMF